MNAQMEKPYVGPRTFQENERDRFFGRDREARDLLALAISEPMVLFYAQSGAGKSSLVNTCLIPDLKSKGFKVFSGRVAGDAHAGIDIDNIYIFNLVRSLLPNEVNLGLLAKLSIKEFFSDAMDHAHQADPVEDVRPHVLIIDQFEELFNTHHEAWEKRQVFFQELAEAMEADPYLWAIFVMREDFIAALDPYAYMLPSRLRMRYYMQRLERDAALEAIKKPVQDLRPFAGGVAETLVDNLARINIKLPDGTLDSQPGQYVEPVQLQVVCYSLWENLKSNRPYITEEDLREVGDVNQSLEKFYDGRVGAVAKEKNLEERLIREWFDTELITISGTRNMVLRNLKNEGGLADNVIQALQGDLVRAEMRGGQTWYELSHDRLIEPVHVSNTKWFTANLSFFQQQAALWVAQDRSDGLLLRGKELEQAELEQSKRESESKTTPKDELDFLAASKKARDREKREKRGNLLVRILAVGATAFMAAAIGLAILANQSSVKANKTSKDNAALVIQGAQLVVDAQNAERTAVALQGVAESKSSLARAGELAAQAQVLGQSNSSRSLLLAIAAFNLNLHAQPDGDILPIVYQALRDSVGRSTGQILSGHSGELTAVSFSPGPESRWLATGDSNGTTQLWNLAAPDAPPFLITSGGYEKIEKLIFSNDNRWLVVLGGSYYYSEGRIRLLDLSTPTNDLFSLDSVLPEGAFVTDVTLGTESKLLAVTYNLGNGGGISLFSTENIKQPLQTLPVQWKLEKVAFSADGTHLVFADEENNIFFWEIAQTVDTIGYVPSNMILITSLRFSPDGVWLAVTGEQSFRSNQNQGIPSAKIYSVKTRNVFREVFDEEDRSPDYVNFSPDGKWITAVYSGNCNYYETDCLAIAKVLLFPVDKPEAQPTVLYAEADAIITSASINGSGRLVAGDATGSARIWDLDSIPSDPKIASAHAGPISILALSPDGRFILSAGLDNIRLWKVESLSSNSILTRRSADPITNVIRSVDGTTLAVGGNSAVVPLRWLELNPDNFNSGTDVRFEGKGGSFTAFALAPKADWMAGMLSDGSDTSFIHLWKTSEPDNPVIAEINSDADAVTFSPDERLLAVADKTGKVRIYEIANLLSLAESGSSTSLQPIELLDTVVGVLDLRFSPNGDQLIVANDERVLIWDIGKRDVPPFTLPARAPIAISPDHKTLATSSLDNTVLLWDLSDLQRPVKFLSGSSEPVTVLTFSEDNTWLAVGSKDRIVRVFNLKAEGSEANTYTLEGHTNTITSLAFSPDEKWLASASSDFTVRLWNVKNLNASPVILRGHDAEIIYVGFTNDGEWVISASADKTIRLWSINATTLVEAACEAAGRNFTPAEWNRFFSDLEYKNENMPCPKKYPIAEVQPTQAAVVATPTLYPTAGVQPTSTPTSPPQDVVIIYEVQPDDTLSQIAALHNVTLAKLMADNNISDPSTLILVGQPLRIIATVTPVR